MRLRIIASLCFVLILIASATWKRFNQPAPPSAQLTTISDAPTSSVEDQQAILDSIIGPSASSTATSSAPLTDTDLVARQLVSDFIDLTANGQTTDARIATLANTYADNITTLVSPSQLSITSLHIVDDSRAHLKTYGDNLTLAYTKYHKLLAAAYNSQSGHDLTSSQDAFVDFAQTLSSIYSREESELEKFDVPASLVEAHLDLVNIYLSNATAYSAMTRAPKDPARALAGIMVVKKNNDLESAALASLEKILTDHGI